MLASVALIAVGLGIFAGKLTGVSASSTSQSTSLNQKAQMSTDGLWAVVSESSIANAEQPRTVNASSYRTLSLNSSALLNILARAPMEFTAEARKTDVEITIPMPDGTFPRFRIVESPISAPDPLGQTPDFRSYSGQGIDDPTATARFDWSSLGFHAQVISSSQTVYVDPYAKGDTTNYLTYDKKSFHKEGAVFECLVPEAKSTRAARSEGITPAAGPNGTTLRSLRTAIAATGEYTNFFRQGGDDDNQAKLRAYNQILITMNRVNGIWGRDISIRFVLVSQATELSIIYPNPATDPYTNGANANTNATNNQTNLDATLGTANYDIGHVFSIGSGGVGGGGVCQANNQAGGATATPNPQGDPFDVDFVAHEVIHQFDGGHTFNESNSGECTPANRTAGVAYEPGSGSTVASYAGTCAAADLQVSSDDYFHSASIDQVLAWVNANACAATTPTGNAPPTVNAGANFNVPANTPFTLTATATDPDGDALTYAWEEFDLGAASPPNTDNGDRPLFRPYRPSVSPSRTFPSLQYILNNANNPTQVIVVGASTPAQHNGLSGENMPTTTRNMKFRVTARDNRGGINTSEMTVNVNAGAGPFAVTSPNTAVSFAGNSQQTITWNVANSNAAPVLAANVKVSLSTDGGNTFPTVLLASTPNDGTEAVTIPNTATTTARIKVEAVGNIFFDISDTNFTITAAATNQIDTADFFVRQHYSDFLNRQPDQSGLNFWTNEITSCGADQACIALKRINVSAAFYISIEFQQTGYLVERIYKASYGDATGNSTFPNVHTLPVPIVRLAEFLPDTQQIGTGVVVGQTGWEAVLEANKVAFCLAFVQRMRFTDAFPTTRTPQQFVDALFLNAGVTPSDADRTAAINEFGVALNTADAAARGRALRRVAENTTLTTNEFNRAFVLMQFFGYLRRNPDVAPDTNHTGYDFWLSKLNSFTTPGDDVLVRVQRADMVKAFILSAEYRGRFGTP